jgi:hypothetical protein
VTMAANPGAHMTPAITASGMACGDPAERMTQYGGVQNTTANSRKVTTGVRINIVLMTEPVMLAGGVVLVIDHVERPTPDELISSDKSPSVDVYARLSKTKRVRTRVATQHYAQRESATFRGVHRRCSHVSY